MTAAWQVLLVLAIGAALGAVGCFMQIGADIERRAEQRRRDQDLDARWHRPIGPPRSHCTRLDEKENQRG